VRCGPEDSGITKPEQLAGKRVATELVGTVRRYFKRKRIKAEVEFSWGATEVKVPDLVDAIVDITETGNSIRANKLRIIDTLLETNTKLIANKASWKNPAKRRKIETIALLLQGALEAESKVGLKMNLRKSESPQIRAGAGVPGVAGAAQPHHFPAQQSGVDRA